MSTWQIVCDVIMLLVIISMIAIGIKRGFVKSFFRSTKMLIVILITVFIGAALIGPCQTYIVNDMFEGKISTPLVEKVENSGENFDFNEIKSALPTLVQGFVPMDEVEEYFNSATGTNTQIAQSVGEKIEGVIIDIVSKAMAYIGTFVLAFIVCTIVIFLIEKIWELPVLNKINKVFGFVWGISGAYIVASFAVFILSILAGMDFVSGTILTNLIYKIGLFTA